MSSFKERFLGDNATFQTINYSDNAQVDGCLKFRQCAGGNRWKKDLGRKTFNAISWQLDKIYCPYTTKPIKTRFLLFIDNKICLKGRIVATHFPEKYCPQNEKKYIFCLQIQKSRIFAA